nr:hypothetical protein [Anaerolineae bacterium]
MFRVIQRGMAGLLALLLLCVLASGVLGQALPPAPVLVSILLPREEQRPARIRGLDLVYGGRFERYVPGGRGFAWSPEGCRIVLQGLSGEDRALRLVDIPGGHSHRYPVPVTRLTAWSPEGRRLVISTPPGAEAGLYIAAAGEYGLQTLPLPDAREEVFQFLWSP